MTEPALHPDFEALGASWALAMDADGYSSKTVTSYQQACRSLGRWLAEHRPGVGPAELRRDDIRGWVVHLRDTASANTARSWFAGVRHFCKWMVAEGEAGEDATQGIKTPRAGDPHTPVLKDDEIRAMLAACAGSSFADRRDAAIIYVFADGGLRLAEVTGLRLDDVDIRDRILFVIGKGSNRSGPRRRAVQLGVKAARALDRYLRERRRHPYHEEPQLWLGARNRPRLSDDGVEAVLKRRGSQAGVEVHPHMFRHTWASQFRRAGGEEGDLMVLGGWRSRQMLDRYGRAAAADRAQASYRQRSLGDRL
jgi:site-specific recombinase XerD